MHCKALMGASHKRWHMAFWDTYELFQIHTILNCTFLTILILELTVNAVVTKSTQARMALRSRQMPCRNIDNESQRRGYLNQVPCSNLLHLLVLGTVAHLYVVFSGAVLLLGRCGPGLLLLARGTRPLGGSLRLANLLAVSSALSGLSLPLPCRSGGAVRKFPTQLLVHLLLSAKDADAVADGAASGSWVWSVIRIQPSD
ncbi:uncharacterized protein M421DRAFT_196071 [Didymella exigua CBS 183.55]|uniref:Uncharacterized protein n=1 Tax=Didymella exigua CBS 183.55 TaxID=1150837 RepID=A0A6A5S4I9_9PLEO|nr:uncharacterized protein M421DRAFT_196071 [Didymella exigua CBS 183.55]KAF1933396.1 hypothetical protein M421DRAFT_196071 [Didymella exigua CBS 183.55]